MASKSIYDYCDAEGFLPETVFYEWCRENNIGQYSFDLSTPRWDGVYETSESWSGVEISGRMHSSYSRDFLRFYPDGTVLDATVSGSDDEYHTHAPHAREIVSWFAKENRNVDRGLYKKRGEQIAMTIKNSWHGGKRPKEVPAESHYLGVCLRDRVAIISKKKGNGASTYDFIQVPGMKVPDIVQPGPSSIPAPMQTLPSSTFARQPVPQMTRAIGTIIGTYQQPGSKVDGLAWSPDGRRIASFGLGEAQVWDPLSGNVLYDYKIKGFATIITAITWSPDSTRVATAGSDKVVQIWDASDGHLLTAYKGHLKFIRCASWSPDGQHIASSEEMDLHIWHAISGQHIFTFTAHPKAIVGVRSLAWSPDATCIATGGGNNHVTVWNPQNGNAISTYTQQRNTINGLAWSPDGKRIVSGSYDKTVHSWAAETGADPIICQGHTKAVNAVAFSPDGKRIASASDDTTVRIWSSATGQLLFTYEGHKKGVKALAWSPDGKYIASGGDDRIVQVWTSSIP